MGFARAFMTERHIAATGLSPDAFWVDLARRLDGVDAPRLSGVIDWAVLHFRRTDIAETLPVSVAGACQAIQGPVDIRYRNGSLGVTGRLAREPARFAHAS